MLLLASLKAFNIYAKIHKGPGALVFLISVMTTDTVPNMNKTSCATFNDVELDIEKSVVSKPSF